MTRRVLGFDFGATKAVVAVGDPDGRVVAEEVFPTRGRSARAVMAEAGRLGARLLERFPAAAVGVATMGITLDRRVVLAPNLPGWQGQSIPRWLETAFPGLPAAIDNDVKAAAQAEIRFGALRGVNAGAYLNLGSGIAIAFVVEGRMWRGAHGAAGEIAYLWRPGEEGFASGHAPFEERAGGIALDRLVRERVPGASGLADLDKLLAHSLPARETARRVAEEIAWGVSLALLTVDVDVLVVGGGISRGLEWIRPVWADIFARYLPFPPRIETGSLGGRAGIMGAIALGAGALDAADASPESTSAVPEGR